jgi:hypothetical protein
LGGDGRGPEEGSVEAAGDVVAPPQALPSRASDQRAIR